MIAIDSYVRHKKTDKFGKVLGYGYKIVNENYLTTLKVELLEEGAIKGFTEDIYTEWILCEAELIHSGNSHH